MAACRAMGSCQVPPTGVHVLQVWDSGGEGFVRYDAASVGAGADICVVLPIVQADVCPGCCSPAPWLWPVRMGTGYVPKRSCRQRPALTGWHALARCAARRYDGVPCGVCVGQMWLHAVAVSTCRQCCLLIALQM